MAKACLQQACCHGRHVRRHVSEVSGFDAVQLLVQARKQLLQLLQATVGLLLTDVQPLRNLGLQAAR